MVWFLVAALVVSAIGAIVDHRTGHIPNWLTHGTLAVAPLAHGARALVAHAGPKTAAIELGWSLAGMALCLAVPLRLYMANAIGGGDVKLFAAIGALVHPSMGFDVVVDAFVAFVILSGVVLARRGKLGQVLGNVRLLVRNRFVSEERRVPVNAIALHEVRMGPAIFAGVAIVATLRFAGVN
jgi:prepilin peptidase CpaA